VKAISTYRQLGMRAPVETTTDACVCELSLSHAAPSSTDETCNQRSASTVSF